MVTESITASLLSFSFNITQPLSVLNLVDSGIRANFANQIVMSAITI
jgi:hypothetical protein